MTLTTTMLPPGDYLIIDPCYILDGDRWQPLLDRLYAEGWPSVVTDPQTGALFAASYTATGDGAYEDQDGHWYGVDSGTLVCLPLEMVDGAQLGDPPTARPVSGTNLLWSPGDLYKVEARVARAMRQASSGLALLLFRLAPPGQSCSPASEKRRRATSKAPGRRTTTCAGKRPLTRRHVHVKPCRRKEPWQMRTSGTFVPR